MASQRVEARAKVLAKSALTLALVVFMFIALTAPADQTLPPLVLGIIGMLAGSMLACAMLLDRVNPHRFL